jgi:hypothetical protein
VTVGPALAVARTDGNTSIAPWLVPNRSDDGAGMAAITSLRAGARHP